MSTSKPVTHIKGIALSQLTAYEAIALLDDPIVDAIVAKLLREDEETIQTLRAQSESSDEDQCC